MVTKKSPVDKSTHPTASRKNPSTFNRHGADGAYDLWPCWGCDLCGQWMPGKSVRPQGI